MAHTHHDTGSGTATGMILGIVLVLVVLAIAAFVFFGGAFRTDSTAPTQQGGERDTNIQINPPAPDVDVKVQPAPGGSGQSSPSGTQQAPGKP